MSAGQRLGMHPTTYYRTISVDNKPTTVIIGPNGEPIKLPESLESLPKSDHFPNQRHRWNTNEEIASMLIAFERHHEWLSKEVKIRPKSGSMLLYSRKKVRYRRDGYCWKKRKDGKTTREDHMKLKVQGMECIYGCYVHSAILPTFHRRCYWLLQNPDIVLVHYLNVPYPDDNKLVIASNISLWGDKKEWTKEELISQLKPMFFSEEEPDLNNELEISTAETVEAIVTQLMEKQRAARTASLNKQLECGCPDSTCIDKPCIHSTPPPPPRAKPTKSEAHTTTPRGAKGRMRAMNNMHRMQQENNNQVSSTTEHLNPHGNTESPDHSRTGAQPLVLSLTQLQTGGGLLIVNSTTGHASSAHAPPPAHFHEKPENGSIGSSPVAAAVRSLNTLGHPEFDLNGSSYDGYSITDSMLGDNRKSNGPLMDFKSAFSDLDSKPGDLSFLHETLDLGHDDLHRTLSANIPDPPKPEPIMDFIEHENGAGSNAFDLETFDMLNEFPGMDGGGGHHYDHQASMSSMRNGHSMLMTHNAPGPMLSSAATNVHHMGGGAIKNGGGATGHAHQHAHQREMAHITDYSPDWAWADGGTKLLVIGPWYSSTSKYQLLFDGVPVPTTLIQTGVLRCVCPAHEAGKAKLEVASEGYVISNTVIFEYKSKTPGPRHAKPNCVEQERVYRHNLLSRLESLGEKLELHEGEQNSAFEDYLVTLCNDHTLRQWRKDIKVSEDIAEFKAADSHGMTLLHLAAALGMSKLACSLLHWSAENSSLLLETEVDPLAQDEQGFTPLMRACANCHTDLAVLLYQWNSAAFRIRNFFGDSCLEIANGTLRRELEHLERVRMEEKIELIKHNEFVKPGAAMGKKSVRASSLDDHIRLGSPCSSRSLRSTSPSVHPVDSPPVIAARRRLSKRSSFDSGINLHQPDGPINPVPSTSGRQQGKEAKKLSKKDRSFSCPSSKYSGKGSAKAMLLKYDVSDESRSTSRSGSSNVRRPDSPIIDVEGLSSDEEEQHAGEKHKTDSKRPDLPDDQKVLSLAEQFIAAMPERIKNDPDVDVDMPPCDASQSDDLGVESMTEDLDLDFDFNLDESYSYREVYTPSSSLSPASSCMHSPLSYSVESPSPVRSFSMEAGSPPGTAADLQEFLQASMKCERDLNNLTLSDQEQRELYEAAQIIQKAYRQYKGRKKMSEGQDREARAAVVIQNYYRRYKQYLYYKQMALAATVIQTKYRTYCEHKRFKKSQEAATCIQNYYRSYKEQTKNRSSREGTPSTGLKRTYSQRRQNQAAKKIQQFMRKSHLKPICEVVKYSRKGMVAERSSCYNCASTSSTRKREAVGDPRSVVPAKLPGYTHHTHHTHHHHQQTNGYYHHGSFYGWHHHQHEPIGVGGMTPQAAVNK